jgi:queuine/archaeosine tRNA-ribosyltransferase
MDYYFSKPVDIPHARFRMDTGLEVLNEWADHASQNQKNAVYKALFAVLDGSVFRTYRIIDDFQRPNEFRVVARDDLAVTVRVHCFDSFGVLHIGPFEDGKREDDMPDIAA